jgi:hypothetical protein
MNIHQHVIPTTTTISPNVHVQGIQVMNLKFDHTVIPIHYKLA